MPPDLLIVSDDHAIPIETFALKIRSLWSGALEHKRSNADNSNTNKLIGAGGRCENDQRKWRDNNSLTVLPPVR